MVRDYQTKNQISELGRKFDVHSGEHDLSIRQVSGPNALKFKMKPTRLLLSSSSGSVDCSVGFPVK